MKLIHLSDLHIGKRVNEFSMLQDQEYILLQILQIIDEEKPQAVLIAGDVYDKTVPSGEAVTLLDDFLCRLAARKLPVLIISGNHDSPERLAFGNRLLEQSGVHISPVYDGKLTPITLTDEHGEVDLWLLPFVKPAHVRRFYPDEAIETYTDACRVALQKLALHKEKRNVLLCHQFVTGASMGGSEEISVGGSDNVDASVFEDFDYVALGHIHGCQNVGSNRVHYCGTPLKYSFSEANQQKSVTVVKLGAKGALELTLRPLFPKRDMRVLKGTYAEVTAPAFREAMDVEDYLHIILTDEEEIPEGMGKLRALYPNLMTMAYDNTRTRNDQILGAAEDVQNKTKLQLFEEFYEKQNNQPMSDVQRSFIQDLIEELWEGRT